VNMVDCPGGTIEVRKDLVPHDDAGRFDLRVDGATKKTGAGDGDTTGAVVVPAGSNHTVGELAAAGTNLSDYSSSIACTRNGNPAESGSGTSLTGVTVNANDAVVCTITNNRLLYPRPRGATPFRVSLTPAFRQCTSPDRQHGAPIAVGSCAPPVQTSGQLTIGSPDANGQAANSQGALLYRVTPGDVEVNVDVTDVRRQGTLADYTGELGVVQLVQITDRSNGPNQDQAATTEASPFRFTVPCAATSFTTIGGACSLASSFNAIVPGSVVAGQRAIWELNKVSVLDPGPNGTGFGAGCPTTCGDGDETVFLRAGLFVP